MNKIKNPNSASNGHYINDKEGLSPSSPAACIPQNRCAA